MKMEEQETKQIQMKKLQTEQLQIEQIKIEPLDMTVFAQIKENWDHVAKPLDGLGEFETLTAQIGAIYGSAEIDIHKKAVIVMCADNGVVEEKISQSGQEVTALVTKCMGEGKSSVGKMAFFMGMDVFPVDIGINTEEIFPGVVNKKVAKGTANFAKQPAMTEKQARQAVNTGIEMVKDCKAEGYRLLATGEMGIGNTTTSSAMAAALLGCSVTEITGRGAGLSDQGLKRKKSVIEKALKQYQLKPEEPLRILCSVGGLDIAGLTGVFLGGAICHIPIVADGVISLVAALTAERLAPGTKAYIIPSHKSREPAAEKILQKLQLQPVIQAGLALGEGTGAVMMCRLLDMALTLYQNQTTFQTMELEPYKRFQ